MPVVGELTNDVVFGRGYTSNSNTRAYASAIREMAENVYQESKEDLFGNNHRVLMDQESKEALKNFFMEGSADIEEFDGDMARYQDHMNMMGAIFENDREAVLEQSALNGYNPVMGLTFPLHKNLLMNNIFDKGAINKAVAKTPKFTMSMKVRKLVKPDGTELDMFTQQDQMFDAIESSAPMVQVPVTLPLTPVDPVTANTSGPQYEIRKAVFGQNGILPNVDNFSIECAVSHIVIDLALPKAGYLKEDGGKYVPVTAQDVTAATAIKVAVPIEARKFEPGYGDIDRQMMTKFTVTYETAPNTPKTTEAYLSGFTQKNQFMLNCSDAAVKEVILSVRRDTSSAYLNTCSVKWDSITNIVEIPDARPINVTLSPEEVKDIQALYNEDQLSNVLSLLKTGLGNYKDDKIHRELDQSFLTMPEANKLAETFDFAPPTGYALDFVEWRHKTFMDALDNYATYLIQVLNDPNVTISVIGAPNLIRKVTPTDYTYQTPTSIGPVTLDFQRTVVTSDKRVYNFISSDKLRNNSNLIIVLNPRNTDRVIYCIYDYQLYLSNEIRNAQNAALPAVHAFERFKLVAYQPVQGRVRILNTTGMRSRIENTDPIGVNKMNDYTMNVPDYVTDTTTPSGYPNADIYTKVNDAKDKLTIPEKVENVRP